MHPSKTNAFQQFSGLFFLLFCGLICDVGASSSAHAFTPTYDGGFENDLSRDVVKPSEFPILNFGFSFDEEERSKGDIHFKFSPSHPKAFALSSRNFYFGQPDEGAGPAVRFSFGRRLVGWSKIDELWQVGEFEPLDSWDRLRSFTQGLTGVFAYTETSLFNIRLFGSYLFLPELTPNIVLEKDQFSPEHPQAISTAPQSFNLLNRATPLGYHLNLPPISQIIFRPSVAFLVETKPENNVYGKFSYAYLPLNYFPIALQASLAIPLDQIVVQLRPRLLQHSLYNAELAYRFNSNWRLGFATLIDQPYPDQIPVDYTTTPLTPLYHFSPWTEYKLARLQICLSQLVTFGGLGADVGDFASPNSSVFSSRLLYRNVTQIVLRTVLSESNAHLPTLQMKYAHEYSILADWIAADFYYSFEPRFRAFIGGDIIAAQKGVSPDRGAEFLADVRAIDRIRFGVNYVF